MSQQMPNHLGQKLCTQLVSIALAFTFEVPVTNCRRRALSSLLNPWTTSQNHWITGDAALYPEYSVFALMSSTETHCLPIFVRSQFWLSRQQNWRMIQHEQAKKYRKNHHRNSQSISGSPLINNSNSLSLKIDINSPGISSVNPSRKAFIWGRIAVVKRCSATKSTYWCLFSSVTLIFRPPGISS